MNLPKRQRMFSSLVLYHACNDGALATLPAMYPILKEVLKLDYIDIGFIASTGLFITLLFQLLVGKIADKHSAKYLLAGGLTILTISLFLLTQITNFIGLLIVIIILRVGASFYHPIGISWISRAFHGKSLDSSMGIQSSFGDSGVFIAFMTTGFIAVRFGWQYPFVIWGILNIMAIIFGLMIVKNNTAVISAPTNIAPMNIATIKRIFKSIKLYLLPFAIGGASYTIGITFGPLLLTDKILLSDGNAGLIIGGWIGIGIFTALFFSKICSALGGRYNTLLISFIIISISGLLIGWSTNVLILFFGFLLFGAMMFISYPALFTLVTDVTDKCYRGVIFGLVFAVQLSGGVFIGFLSGWLSDIIGISTPFYILTILGLITVIWLFIVKKYQIS